MCGTSVFKFEDFKSHTIINGRGGSFNKVTSWFWAIVSNFTQEEMARYNVIILYSAIHVLFLYSGWYNLQQVVHSSLLEVLRISVHIFRSLQLPHMDNFQQHTLGGHLLDD